MKFVIFGQARSGTTTLLDLIRAHPQIKAIIEPFNPSRGDWGKTYVTDNKDLNQLKRALIGLDKEVDGFKHLIEQSSYEGNRLILDSTDRIISIRRHNHLKTVLSNFICRQANHWRHDKNRILNHNFVPIDMDKFKPALRRQKDKWDPYTSYLEKDNVFSLTYESFYLGAPEEQLKTLQKIYTHLGLGPIRNLKKVLELFEPANRQLNSPESYQRIPNIDQIAALGSDENGYLY